MKFYLAGPFFNESERLIIEKVHKVLQKYSSDIFVPMEHFIENGESLPNNEWGNKVFEMDKKAIDECDIIVAVYHGMYSDSGTAWEIGYGYAKNKIIIIININILTSVMINNACYASIYLKDIDDYDFNELPKINVITIQK